jgi:hypothetical protein
MDLMWSDYNKHFVKTLSSMVKETPKFYQRRRRRRRRRRRCLPYIYN